MLGARRASSEGQGRRQCHDRSCCSTHGVLLIAVPPHWSAWAVPRMRLTAMCCRATHYEPRRTLRPRDVSRAVDTGRSAAGHAWDQPASGTEVNSSLAPGTGRGDTSVSPSTFASRPAAGSASCPGCFSLEIRARDSPKDDWQARLRRDVLSKETQGLRRARFARQSKRRRGEVPRTTPWSSSGTPPPSEVPRSDRIQQWWSRPGRGSPTAHRRSREARGGV